MRFFLPNSSEDSIFKRAMTFALNQNDRLYGRGWFARLFDKTEIALKGLP